MITKGLNPKLTECPTKRREFGTILQRKDGTWEGKYTFEGQRKSIYAESEEEIENALLLIRANIKNQIHVEESSMFLKDWIERWLNNYVKPSVRHSTYISYDGFLRKHVIPVLGHVTLKSLDGERLQKFFNAKGKNGRCDTKQGGLSNKTLRNIRNALNSCFEQAIYDKKMFLNPLAGVKLPKHEAKEMRVLTRTEMYRLLEICRAADTRFAYGVIFTLYTGVRLGELLGLSWSDVEWNGVDDTSVQIRHTLSRQTKPSKNDPDYKIISWHPGDKTAITLGRVKTSKSRRKLILPTVAYECLTKLKAWQDEMSIHFDGVFNPNGFIFTSLKGEAMEPRTFLDCFYDLVKVSGIAHTNFHALRHTFATRGNEYGIDAATLADLLGHAQTSTTMNMYVHSQDDQKRKARNTFNQM
jgi:integrase